MVVVVLIFLPGYGPPGEVLEWFSATGGFPVSARHQRAIFRRREGAGRTGPPQGVSRHLPMHSVFPRPLARRGRPSNPSLRHR